jgi:acyl-CoA thioesterase-1
MLRSLIIAFLLGFAVIANSNAQIVAPGASSTAGYGVGASSAYPAQLEAILRARTMKGMSLADAAANRAEIRRRLHARGIRTIEADGYVQSAVRSGHRQPDGIHMTVEGHRKVAHQLAASIR